MWAQLIALGIVDLSGPNRQYLWLLHAGSSKGSELLCTLIFEWIKKKYQKWCRLIGTNHVCCEWLLCKGILAFLHYFPWIDNCVVIVVYAWWKSYRVAFRDSLLYLVILARKDIDYFLVFCIGRLQWFHCRDPLHATGEESLGCLGRG